MSEAADSSIEKQLAEKALEQGHVFRDIGTTRSTFTNLKTHTCFGYIFTIPTSGNIYMRLGQCTSRCLCGLQLLKCVEHHTRFRTTHQLMHGRLEFQCSLWPVMQIYMSDRYNVIYDMQGLSMG